jgi:hypothetical protein
MPESINAANNRRTSSPFMLSLPFVLRDRQVGNL